jgi:Glyoxalase/Bleomycin resistance protein/Dioxygenase superfamily
MHGRIPLQRLVHANVVVHDLRATARNYARILGIARWQVHNLPGYASATASNPTGVTFRLVQPTDASTSYAAFLGARGEGVHSLCTAELAEPELIDTREALGGYSIEIAPLSAAAPDEEWELRAEVRIPPEVEWIANIPRIGHFGIAVTNLEERIPRYAELLGIESWTRRDFHRAPESMTSSTYLGEPVDNAWLIALTDVADFGLELLQETRGPTDYGDTIARSGEGIHHVLVRRGLSDADWQALNAWMSSMQIGVVMGATLRGGAAEFAYFDTRAALGFLLEVIIAPAGRLTH